MRTDAGEIVWGLVLVGTFVVGVLATAIVLLRRARGTHAALRRELANGTISWGGQVRWRRADGRWGSGGTLTASNGKLLWTPIGEIDARQVPVCSWDSSQVKLIQRSSRRDITGIRFVEYELVAGERTFGRFGLLNSVGRLPVAVALRAA